MIENIGGEDWSKNKFKLHEQGKLQRQYIDVFGQPRWFSQLLTYVTFTCIPKTITAFTVLPPLKFEVASQFSTQRDKLREVYTLKECLFFPQFLLVVNCVLFAQLTGSAIYHWKCKKQFGALGPLYVMRPHKKEQQALHLYSVPYESPILSQYFVAS